MPKPIESFIRSTKSVAMTYFTIESYCVVFIQIVECSGISNLWHIPVNSAAKFVNSCDKCFDSILFFLFLLCVALFSLKTEQTKKNRQNVCIMYEYWRSSQLVNRAESISTTNVLPTFLANAKVKTSINI